MIVRPAAGFEEFHFCSIASLSVVVSEVISLRWRFHIENCIYILVTMNQQRVKLLSIRVYGSDS